MSDSNAPRPFAAVAGGREGKLEPPGIGGGGGGPPKDGIGGGGGGGGGGGAGILASCRGAGSRSSFTKISCFREQGAAWQTSSRHKVEGTVRLRYVLRYV